MTMRSKKKHLYKKFAAYNFQPWYRDMIKFPEPRSVEEILADFRRGISQSLLDIYRDYPHIQSADWEKL
jgi:hypothetical protein